MRKLVVCCVVALSSLPFVFSQTQRPRTVKDPSEKAINLDEYTEPEITNSRADENLKRQQYQQDINKGWEIASVTKQIVFLYDPKSVRAISPTLRNVWMKYYIKNTPGSIEYELERRRKSGLRLEGYEAFSHTASLMQFDCMQQRSRVTAYADYDAEGKTIQSASGMDGKWNDVVPDSIADHLMQAVCKPRTRK